MIKLQTDTGPTMASISDMDALKNYIPHNKLKLYPTPMVGWHRERSYYSRVLPGCKIFF